jgi:FAS-associated factor 2
MFAVILRFLLWPVRRVSEFLLPVGEFDGLSPAVTEKAAQQFVNHLKTLSTSPTQSNSINEAFSTSGFVALKQEATATNSLLVVYLHSPLHRKGDEMCQKLIHPTMLQFFNQNNIKTLGSSIHTSQGASLSQQLSASSFPVLALLQPGNGNSDAAKLVFKAEGPSLSKMQPAQLLPLLNGTYQRFLSVVAEQVARRIEREQEQDLRRQQDEEYQETLRADQARERQRQEERELEERRIQEEEERLRRKEREETERLDKARALVRPEPSSGGTRIRFALPSGQKVDRRFENDETVGALKAFLILHFAENNLNIKNVALSTNFPKKTHDEDEKTLQESDLCPQSVLMVQDLDA